MTFFSTPMARQFVGFDSLFDELNEMAARKDQIIPLTTLPKMMKSITASRSRWPDFPAMTSRLRPKKAC